MYDEPFESVEFLLHYFVSRELNIANTISRHFEWSQNIVFFEDLPGSDGLDQTCVGFDSNSEGHNDICSTGKSILSTHSVRNTIILSSTDGIVPSIAIDRYLNAKYKEGHRFPSTCLYILPSQSSFSHFDSYLHLCLEMWNTLCLEVRMAI